MTRPKHLDDSIRGRIAAMHRENPSRTPQSIAREVGCAVRYVRSCYSQLGLRVGKPPSDQPFQPPIQSHKVTMRWEPNRRRIEHCRYVSLQNGAAVECGNPTGGRTYCPDCKEKTSPERANRYKTFMIYSAG